MYGITLDRSQTLSLTRQLCAALRSGILAGTIPRGTKLMSTREAAQDLCIARNVIISAYEQLEAEGYLDGKTGSGTRVTDLGTRVAPIPEGFRADPDVSEKIEKTSLIDFSSACGTPDLSSFPIASWKKCMTAGYETAPERSFSFSDGQGEKELLEELSSYLFRARGLECSPSQIFCTQGIIHAMTLTAQFLRPQTGQALLEDPALNALRRILKFSGYRTVHHPVDASGLCTETLPPLTEKTLYVTSSAHQFPVGGILPVARRLELIDHARSCAGWIFEDDYDGDLRLKGLPIPPIQTLAPDLVFYSGTFNKTLFPSVRMGYLVIPEQYVRAFKLFRLGISDWNDSLSERTLARFLHEGFYEKRIHNLKKIYSARRSFIIDALNRSFGSDAAVYGSEAGTHCRIRFTRGMQDATDWDILENFGAKVTPISRYVKKSEIGGFRDDILMGYGNLDQQDLSIGIERIQSFLGTRN